MSENFWIWIAWRLPRKLVYWCTIRVAAHSSQGRWSGQEVPALTVIDALDRWKRERER